MVPRLSQATTLQVHPTTSDSAHILAVPNYERQLDCQIWSLDGRLVARTRGRPEHELER